VVVTGVAVLLPDCELGVRRALPPARDGHGDRIPGGWGGLVGPAPGRAAEGPDVPGAADAENSRVWSLGVDPGLWPIGRGDLVVDPVGGREWLVVSADLLESAVDPGISWVRVSAHLRSGGGTRP
jgi:hypothetical protein